MEMDLEGKRILVAGLGMSGIGAVEALLKKEVDVAATDRKSREELDPALLSFLEKNQVELLLGSEPTSMEGYDLIVLSPGISPDGPLGRRAMKAGVPVIGEIELAWLMAEANYVAITGTNGKTTTTVLVGEIFKNAGLSTEVVGNVGVAVTTKAISASKDTWMITEISSFQLETIREFRPKIAALLNITPDHMDRHGTLEEYGAAKARIFMNQGITDFFIVNRDDPESWKVSAFCPATMVPFSRKQELSFGAFVLEGDIIIRDQAGDRHRICSVSELRIPGSHNLENALAAAAIAFFAGIDPAEIGDTMKRFQGVAHRLEYVGEINGIRFVNDSKGTNPDASIKAIEAMEGGTVLIAGGYDKESTYDDFLGAFGNKVHTLVLMGKTGPKIRDAALAAGFSNIIMTAGMEESVGAAYRAASPGETVLLSPACASWDMYSCFEERGEHFKKCVATLGNLKTTDGREHGQE
ncbi:MAG: UDP-N-acetylmuramoyl-L-alanine--D-glutamate ligase [Firmicutes bacterium HGW-Firmicutes-11]|nr:MAG: UDP-N-acetylmuramoyl-L-alanine--D-glutamate ligase [Firmicutes bacterium HGW-Firmicutes-11]